MEEEPSLKCKHGCSFTLEFVTILTISFDSSINLSLSLSIPLISHTLSLELLTHSPTTFLQSTCSLAWCVEPDLISGSTHQNSAISLSNTSEFCSYHKIAIVWESAQNISVYFMKTNVLNFSAISLFSHIVLNQLLLAFIFVSCLTIILFGFPSLYQCFVLPLLNSLE